jgi:hypothetical protein
MVESNAVEDIKKYSREEVGEAIKFYDALSHLERETDKLYELNGTLTSWSGSPKNPHHFYQTKSCDDMIKNNNLAGNGLQDMILYCRNFIQDHRDMAEDCFSKGELESFEESLDTARRRIKETQYATNHYKSEKYQIGLDGMFNQLKKVYHIGQGHSYNELLTNALLDYGVLQKSQEGCLVITDYYQKIPSLEEFVKELNKCSTQEIDAESLPKWHPKRIIRAIQGS